jgi:hypothetical protein
MNTIDLADNMQILKIAIHEMDEFVKSDLYKKFKIKPISPNRVISYKNNPRSESTDKVIYLLLKNNELACFRTLVPDKVFTKEETIRFCWLSGNYTKPEHRRKGYSKILLNEILKDWDNKLMYTNFAMESHFLYSDSGKFDKLTERSGRRYYGKINLKTYIHNSKVSLLLPFGNMLLKIASSIKRFKYKPYKSIKTIKQLSEIPEDAGTILNLETNLFKRTQSEFNWIKKYPWLTTDEKHVGFLYPFSFYTKSYNYYYIEVKQNTQTANILILDREGDLKVPYARFSDNFTAAKAILNYCYQSKAKTLTILNKELSLAVSQLKKPFVYSKVFKMGIYTSFPIKNSENYTFQDGDGDNVFT